uniref:hypothetical protein n=1 Tax=Brucella pseudintermedia TaxID=370111 RepID=UPI001AEE6A2D
KSSIGCAQRAKDIKGSARKKSRGSASFHHHKNRNQDKGYGDSDKVAVDLIRNTANRDCENCCGEKRELKNSDRVSFTVGLAPLR